MFYILFMSVNCVSIYIVPMSNTNIEIVVNVANLQVNSGQSNRDMIVAYDCHFGK